MHRSICRAAVSTALLVSLAACGGAKGPSDADVEKRLTTELRAQGLNGTQATCFARIVIKSVGVDKVKSVRFDAAAPSEAMSKDLVAAAATARTSCKIDASKLGGG